MSQVANSGLQNPAENGLEDSPVRAADDLEVALLLSLAVGLAQGGRGHLEVSHRQHDCMLEVCHDDGSRVSIALDPALGQRLLADKIASRPPAARGD